MTTLGKIVFFLLCFFFILTLLGVLKQLGETPQRYAAPPSDCSIEDRGNRTCYNCRDKRGPLFQFCQWKRGSERRPK
jgi:hypothetical protein